MIYRLKILVSVNHDLQTQDIKDECKLQFTANVCKSQFVASVNCSLQIQDIKNKCKLQFAASVCKLQFAESRD